MFKRDETGLKNAKKNNANFVCAKLSTGAIIGYFSYERNARRLVEKHEGAETFTVEEYEWLTDDQRETKVVTGADLADKIKWTRSGFEIDGKKYKTKV